MRESWTIKCGNEERTNEQRAEKAKNKRHMYTGKESGRNSNVKVPSIRLKVFPTLAINSIKSISYTWKISSSFFSSFWGFFFFYFTLGVITTRV